MWAEESVFYQIYPLGFCGAPKQNDGVTVNRIAKVKDWIPHLLRLNINAVYFSPVFESDKHGYDTRDYRTVDCRLGTNDDFADVCRELHDNQIKIVLDGVFNHVGRGFFAFQDVIKNRENSNYKDWFYIDFNGNTGYNDGFYYEAWEGHYELVKLRLENNDVVTYLFDSIKKWVADFNIDGLRLDVAYCLNEDFMRRLREFANTIKPDFYLIGEVLFGDYNRIVNDAILHSCTNYECYKGLYSSFNDMNLFEIAHSLNRQFSNDQYALYKNKHLLSFVDNHDVSRIATMLNNKKHIPLIYAVLFAMPGIPCIYYGSEWGETADKSMGDDALRISFDEPNTNELTDIISRLGYLHRNEKSLKYGSYRHIYLTNHQLVFVRECENELVIVAVNASDNHHTAGFNEDFGECLSLIDGEKINISNSLEMPGYSFNYFKTGLIV